MKTGMLWFDNDPKTDLPSKISLAATYYQKKYGKRPNLCFVHPSMLKEDGEKARDIEIRSNKSVRPNHLWLEVSEHGAVIS
jgi:hypothetical protein